MFYTTDIIDIQFTVQPANRLIWNINEVCLQYGVQLLLWENGQDLLEFYDYSLHLMT
jgi:hypothetical protein